VQRVEFVYFLIFLRFWISAGSYLFNSFQGAILGLPAALSSSV